MKAMAWIFTDARGVERRGYVERTADRGGTDTVYYMRDDSGALHALSGALIRDGAYTLGYAIDVDDTATGIGG